MTTDTTPGTEAPGGTPAPEAKHAPETQDPAKPAEPAQPDKEAPAAPVGAPEQYAPVTAPEGLEVDAAAVDSFLPTAKALNLTQEQLQGLVEYQARQAAETQQALVEGWESSLKADKEFGGANYESNKLAALKAVGAFGSPELVEFFNTTGLGSHPEIVKAFAKIGKTISEDRFHPETKTGSQKTLAERMYPQTK